MRSPVPITSCQRASTSPRSSAPLRTASSTSSSAALVGVRGVLAQRRRPSPPARPARRSRRSTRRGRLSSAPVSVRRTSPARACPSAASSSSHARTGRERRGRAGGRPRAAPPRRPAAGRPARPRSASMLRRCAATSGDGLGRDAVEHERQRGAAVARRLQQLPRHGVGVAGGGRDEQPRVGRGEQLPRERAVGLHHRVDVGRVEQGEARRQRLASARAAASRPPEAIRVVRLMPGRIRSSSNQCTSSGWQTSTGARVVGRRTPAGLTSSPTRLLTSVDLPAPVEPPTTISSGASICSSRGSR